jgi:type I restriction enzyme, R subunit
VIGSVPAKMSIFAGRGVAVYEFQLATGFADYLLYLDGNALGTIEAKPEGISSGSAISKPPESGLPFGDSLISIVGS